MTVRYEFVTRCEAERGWYLDLRRQQGNLNPEVIDTYGPLTLDELHQVTEDATWSLVSALVDAELRPSIRTG